MKELKRLEMAEATAEEWKEWRSHFDTGWGGGVTLMVWKYQEKIVCWGLKDSNSSCYITDLYWNSNVIPCGKYGFGRTYANRPIALEPLGVIETSKGLVLAIQIYNKYETIKHIPLY